MRSGHVTAVLYINDKGNFRAAPENEILNAGMRYRNAEVGVGTVVGNPQDLVPFLNSKIGHLEYEVFVGVWLDADNQFLRYEEFSKGTTNSSMVYVREILKSALTTNARSVIFSHNHPSGNEEPSQQDTVMTHKLVIALSAIDVTVLDHIILGAKHTSLHDRNLLGTEQFEI